MLYGFEYTHSEMHREGSPLTNVVIGSVGPNTERPNTLHPGSDPIPAECVNQTVGCVEEHNDMNSHDWIWGSNCIHPYSDTLSRHPVSNHQGHQEIPGVSNNGYLPSSHFHHHHHLPQRTGASSAGIYIHNHHNHHQSNNQHHHQQEHQQGHCANGHNNNNNNNNNNNYSIPVSNPDERPSHHPTLSLSVGYNAAAVAAAAAAIAAAASANSGLPGGMTLGTGKPKRRRIPTVAQRRAANIRERRRMFNLNEAFDTLRKRVPTFAYEKRLSRIETLRLAITYISFMTDVVSGKEPANIKLHGTKTFSWEALHALPPELTLHSKSLGL